MDHLKRNKSTAFILYPFSLIYGFITAIRNRMYDFNILNSKEFEIPLISVGNITVGGTGKTPHVEYIVSILKDIYKVATLSRGYKRKTKGFRLVVVSSTARESGDEPLQIKLKYPEIAVAVAEKRASGIRKLQNKFKELNAIILDDAFQHRSVKPGLSILLVDYTQPITKDYMLPFGRLREYPVELRRANIIIVTKCPEKIKPIEKRLMINELKPYPYQNLYFTTFTYGNLIPVFKNAANEMTKEECRIFKPGLLLITGIANPRMLKRFLRGISPKITELKYPDHHVFTASDIKKIITVFEQINADNKFIITTEKDAVRLKDVPGISPEIQERIFYVPVQVKFLDNDVADFSKQIISYVQKNRPINNLYSK